MAGLTKEEYEKIRKELDESVRPLYFYHDDTDGLASFLLFYRYKKEGSGVVVKAAPNLDKRFLKKVREFQPDKIFLLDLPLVDQEFIDGCNCPIIWVDHHPPVIRHKIKHFNPRNTDDSDNTCAAQLCYEVVKHEREKDLWISAIGTVGDWQLGPVTKEFAKQYPELLSSKIKDPEKALFETKLGHLVRIYDFLLKGPTKNVLQSVKILTRINDPYEITNETTSRAKLLMKRFRQIDTQYQELLSMAKEQASKSPYLIFIYRENKISLSGELANELMYTYPKKTIIVARNKSGEMKCSFRSVRLNLPQVIEKALVNVTGYGGGHDHACGGCINTDNWELFLEQFKEAAEEQLKKN